MRSLTTKEIEVKRKGKYIGVAFKLMKSIVMTENFLLNVVVAKGANNWVCVHNEQPESQTVV